jgi:hypothetical protein
MNGCCRTSCCFANRVYCDISSLFSTNLSNCFPKYPILYLHLVKLYGEAADTAGSYTQRTRAGFLARTFLGAPGGGGGVNISMHGSVKEKGKGKG